MTHPSSAACKASADGSVAEPGLAQIGAEWAFVDEPSPEEHPASDVAIASTTAAAARPSRRDARYVLIAHLDLALLALIVAPAMIARQRSVRHERAGSQR
jgi:hypothetical protein